MLYIVKYMVEEGKPAVWSEAYPHSSPPVPEKNQSVHFSEIVKDTDRDFNNYLKVRRYVVIRIETVIDITSNTHFSVVWLKHTTTEVTPI